MKTIFSEDHRLQDGKSELIDGKLVPCFEMPRRAEIVLARIKEQKLGAIFPTHDFGLDTVLRIHKPDFVSFLRTAWDRWVAAHGTYDALPLSWLAPGMRRIAPTTIDGQMGYYSFDAGTPITAGTWRAITASANVALTAQALVAAGEPAAFALCRPPGHHAGSGFYGGYCFLNNAAVAAQAFRDNGATKVAVLDVDYHHGNGTQEIFYARNDVLFASIHADPRQEYPFFLGYADETGEDRGAGCNLNLPLAWGSDWATYQPALETALTRIHEFGADALVVSLGVDTFEGDPISRFKLRHEDFLRMGELIANLKLPTLFVMEGGYAVEALGINVVNVLTGFEGTAR